MRSEKRNDILILLNYSYFVNFIMYTFDDYKRYHLQFYIYLLILQGGIMQGIQGGAILARNTVANRLLTLAYHFLSIKLGRNGYRPNLTPSATPIFIFRITKTSVLTKFVVLCCSFQAAPN